MTEKNGGSAFPWDERNDDGSYFCTHEGMTLRDYFAAKAMQGELSAQSQESGHYSRETADGLAGFAYAMADAMLKARKVQS